MYVQINGNKAVRSRLHLACKLAFSASALVLVSGQVMAQTNGDKNKIPNPQILQREIELKRPSTSDADLPSQPIRREIGKPLDEIKITVSRYVIKGLSRPVPAELEASLQQFTGKDRSFEDLSSAADTVTRYLQSELGYYLGNAYLPEQKMRDGIVEIDVLEGRLDRIVLNWNDELPVSRKVVEAHLAHLKPGDILRVQDVERVVFLTNDLLGMTASFEIKAGSTPGTSTLLVTPRPDKRITAQLDGDNHGSRFSGEHRIGAGFMLNSPFGMGDGFSFNTLTSTDDGTRFGLLSYTIPLGSDGLKAGISYSKMHYELDLEELPLDLRGEASSGSLFSIYPLIRSRNANIFLQANYDKRQFVDRQVLVGIQEEKHSRVTQIGLTGDFRDAALSGGVNTISATYSYGRIERFQDSFLSQDLDKIKKLTLGYSRLQNIIDNRLLMLLRYSGQISFANLDTTEQFSLGGANGVRAYAPGEATGDQGHIATAELRILPPNSWGPYAREFVGSIFYDAGWIRLEHEPGPASAGQDNEYSLRGAGLGMVWERPRNFMVRGNVAWRLTPRGTSDSQDRVPRFYFSLSKKFD